MDSVLPALLRVTTALLELGERAAAGDLAAVAELEAVDALLAPRYGEGSPVPGSVAAC